MKLNLDFQELSYLVKINYHNQIFACYAEVKHSDWMLQVVWLVLTN